MRNRGKEIKEDIVNKDTNLDVKALEGWLWGAACKIRGEVDAAKFKDYILPLIFLKRLSDVFDDELDRLADEYGGKKEAEEIVEEDHSLVWFYLPKQARWEYILKQSTKLGEILTDAVRSISRENPKLQGVIDFVDFNSTASGQRIIGDDKLKLLIDTLNIHRLGLKDVEPDILGRAYEYLLRKFAEGSGQSAGEFYTPKEVAILMSLIVDPEQGEEVYDPCLGSGGLLIKCYLRFRDKFGDNTKVNPLNFCGQEFIHTTYAMAKMNAFIHRMEADIALGDTMNKPAFKTPEGSLKTFDIVLANPMWNQEFQQGTYENDTYNRFNYGYPPTSSADWGWIQHMFASLKNNGRMAIVLDAGSVSRGSNILGNNKEKNIRKEFIEEDFIEAVIQLPDNLFYNTPAQGIILVFNKNKKNKGKIILIDASTLYTKGKPKNYISEKEINQIAELYTKFEEKDGLSKIITKKQANENDYNLLPLKYINGREEKELKSIKELISSISDLDELKQKQDNRIKEIFNKIIEKQKEYSKTQSKFPNDWKIKPFTECIEPVTTPKLIKFYQPEYKSNGKYAIIHQGIEKIAGYHNDETRLYKGKMPIIIFGDVSRTLKFIDFPFSLGADGSKIIVPKQELLVPKYFYYYLKTLDIPSRGYNRHYKDLRGKDIIIPPKPEQEIIANILTEIEEGIENQDNSKFLLMELFKTTINELMAAKLRVNDLELKE